MVPAILRELKLLSSIYKANVAITRLSLHIVTQCKYVGIYKDLKIYLLSLGISYCNTYCALIWVVLLKNIERQYNSVYKVVTITNIGLC